MIKVKFLDSNQGYYVKFRRVQNNVVKIIGDGIPKNTSGFKTYTENDVQLGDFSDYTTIYSIEADGIKFSNDGSVEPTKTVTIGIEWEDDDNIHKARPNQVNVSVSRNGVITKEILAQDNWTKTYTLKLSDDYFLVDGDEVDGYTKSKSSDTLIYSYIEVDPVPSTEERLEDLEAAVCELYEMLGGE